MTNWAWIVVAAAIAAAVLLVLALLRIRSRRAHLRGRFGPEYHRAVSQSGTGPAERRLSEIEQEHDRLDLRPLPSAARDRYLDQWRQAEARFVSDPLEAARWAERLVAHALEERGYPAEHDVEGRAALMGVDHPDVAERYRHGRAMLDGVDGAESTENLRKAMVDFRAVLEELVQGQRAAA